MPQPARRRWILAAAAGYAGAAAGCSFAPDHDHDGPDAPQAAPLARPPRVAWVFSSGGPRGFVHVGVLVALAELRLVPDLIVGASVGALIGVLFAAGIPATEIRRRAFELQPQDLARINAGAGERFSGSALAGWVRAQVRLPLERLPLAAVCVAQRLADGQVVGFSRGDPGVAVQAAAAIPGTFTPVRIRGQRYADADGAMPLPVRIARALGATRVLAVDASAHEDRAPPGAERWRETDLKKRALTRPDAALADVLLHPDIGYWAGLSREYRERVAAAGYRATMAEAPRLRALHGIVG